MLFNMSFRCLLVSLFFIIYCFGTPSLALDCGSMHKKTCDECVKCGGIWCKNVQEPLKCVSITSGGDDWCPNLDDRDIVEVDPNTRDGTVFRPKYEEMVAEINSGKVTTLVISGARNIQSANVKVNTAQSVDESKVHVNMTILKSKLEVTTKILDGFCSATSPTIEHVSVEVSIGGVDEKAVLKYHVPCACACSETVAAQAPECSGLGDLVCGVCRCNGDRRGKYCECGKPSQSCIDSSNTECLGNGRCDKCDMCQCNEQVNIPGTERFDPQDNCKDITSTVDDFFNCLTNSEERCGTCDHDIVFQKWNATLSKQKDGDRRLWVDLKATGKPYWATRGNGKIFLMRKPQPGC